jgi:allophanate hydrolase subunit 1
VYLPNNFKYVARNKGLEEEQMRDVLLGTPWTVVAIGFFVMLPLLIVRIKREKVADIQPTDPRKRVLAQKYNPSRTKTCEGAVGLAGVIGS